MTDTLKDLLAAKAERYIDKVYTFLADVADRRTLQYKQLNKFANNLIEVYGEDSIELNIFFDADITKAKNILKIKN